MLESTIQNIFNGYTKCDEPEYSGSATDSQKDNSCKIIDIDNFKVKRFYTHNSGTIESFFLDYLVKASAKAV